MPRARPVDHYARCYNRPARGISNMPLFDTHAHLDDEQFDADRDAVVARAHAAGVSTIVAVGTAVDSSQKCIDLAARYAGVYAAVGMQPNHCAEAQPGDWDRIVQLAGQPGVVALGETGLDRYWDYTPFEIQQDYFDRHLRLSQQLDLPFIVHMRDCGADIVQMLRDARQRGPLSGVMHSFTGDAALAAECFDLGLDISFAGMVTYNKSDELRAVAAAIPNDRILIETDAPYLSPHPKRGQRPNEPALLVHTAACLAKVRGVSADEFAAQTTMNARRLFTRCA
jgi:TatD DNase family protein